MNKYKVNNSADILHSSNRDFLKSMNAKGIIGFGRTGDENLNLGNFDYDKSLKVQNQAPIITTPNINLPLGAGNWIMPKDVEILTAVQTADRIAKPQKLAGWGYNSVSIKITEHIGRVSPDDGSANDTIKSGTNYDIIYRGVFPYAGFWGNNDLGRTTAGLMQQNLQSDDVTSLMNGLSINRNQIFFTGVSEKDLAITNTAYPVYGFLNDPKLLAYNTVSGGYWSAKTMYQIYEDVAVNAYSVLNEQSGGLVDEGMSNGKGRLKLCYSLAQRGYLNKVIAVGGNSWISAKKLISEEFEGKIDFIAVPQMNMASASTDVFYLMYEEDKFGDTVINGFAEMARAYPIFTKHSELSQKISAATEGCIVRIPMFITRYNGIGTSTAFDTKTYFN